MSAPSEKMIDCPFATHMGPREDDTLRCAPLVELVGFECGITSYYCKVHIAAGGPDVPIEDVPRLAKLLIKGVAGRLKGGDCPRYGGESRFNLDEAFARLAARCSKDELEGVFIKALEHWIAISREHGTGDGGGHTDEVIAQKAQRIADAHGLNDVLEAWGRERA